MKRTVRYIIYFLIFFLGITFLSSCANRDEGDTSNGDEAIASPSPAPEVLTLTSPGAGFDFNDPPDPQFREVSVHDPSVFRVGDTFYIIGSHMAMARSTDLIAWDLVAAYVNNNNPLMYNLEDFAEAFAWARTDTFWAGDVQPMPDGRFYMYYCNCEGSMPLGNIGLAIADHPEGPYMNQGIFLKSGMHGVSEDGTTYNANRHPNAIDPHVFFDSQGELWMLYGSFSGGIFIIRMDAETGLPLPGQGYGTRLMGNNHSRIEGPYMQFSPETGYYYLFVTFGGLGREDGYNLRVARSRNVDGPFYDARGNPMINVHGRPGSFFDDRAIEPYGTKIMGGYSFRREPGEPRTTTRYLSPGHNSVYYDQETGRYFLIFHTRFFHTHEHRVRVHEMWPNDDGWFVVSPFRYDGTLPRTFAPEHVPGSWKIINHGQEINYTSTLSTTVNFNADGTITGPHTGTWQLEADGITLNITLDGVTYNGRLLRSFISDFNRWGMSFTAMSQEGIALWGAGFTPA